MNTPMNLSGARALAVGAGLGARTCDGRRANGGHGRSARWNHRCDGEGRH